MNAAHKILLLDNTAVLMAESSLEYACKLKSHKFTKCKVEKDNLHKNLHFNDSLTVYEYKAARLK